MTRSLALNSAEALYQQRLDSIFVKQSRLLAALMVVQWLAAIIIALVVSPYAWEGKEKVIHAHVAIAFLLGALNTSLPVYLAWKHPTANYTRHTIVAAQMLWSALLIHLLGGRIEAHFHIFCSLGFFVAYRDWKVFITATLVVAAEHFLRSVFWPESIYGIVNPAWWRFLEHAGWVVFCSGLLIYISIGARKEAYELSRHEFRLMEAIRNLSLGGKTITNGASFLAATSDDLLKSSMEQMTATEQLATTNEELRATAEQNRELAKTIHEKVVNTQTQIQNSSNNLSALTNAIETIKNSSVDIQNINNLVNDIAYQTNILSLNAMIEASRLSDENSGFKVVALEVKRLAERTANAASNINKLLVNNFNTVKEVADITSTVQASFINITREIQPLAVAITSISNSSIEQSEGIIQVSDGIKSIEASADHQKLLADKAAGIANKLNDDAKMLLQEAESIG